MTQTTTPAAAAFHAAMRAQRAAYFAWQNEPAGQTAARDAYMAACKAMDDAEHAARAEG